MGEPQIVTVTGTIPASELGPTLAHEHLHSDFSVFSGKPDNRFMVASEVIQELAWFRQAGGQCIVEVTPEGTGRDPAQLREISRASGVQVISGIAFYEESTFPAWAREASVEQIAEFFILQLEEGQAGVRAGIIGELTSHNESEPNPSAYRLRTVGMPRVRGGRRRATSHRGLYHHACGIGPGGARTVGRARARRRRTSPA